MSAPPQSLIAGADRPLRLRRRKDLIVREHMYQGRNYWVLKDPLAQKYYRFEAEEFALLQMLDGEASLLELQARFERQFAPQKISLLELHQLVGMLHRNGLACGDAAGQGAELLKRRQERRRRERLSAWTNVLAIRFKGIDPDRLLTWLDKRVGWFFAPCCVAVCVALCLAALLLVTAQFDVFRSRLPDFNEFFATGNWLWLAVTLGLTKILHEFGHGLSCKRFGGECHEMGLMLLVLTPCLYCNVSDSWLLPSKWQRAAIGAAGMYCEVVLASLATFVWWFSEPGTVHFLALNVMFICSVSTLLFNANPLLRYDGYYILSDLVEIPNLRQKASSILQRKCGKWLVGLPETPDPFLPQRKQWFFAAYSLASALYRWVVVVGILWFIYHLFEPYGLQVVGQALAGAALYGLLVQPLVQLVNFFRVPGRMEQVEKVRLLATAGCGCVLLAAVFVISWPHYVRCEVVLQPRDAAIAYVEAPGMLTHLHVRPGQHVPAGQPLVELTNLDLQIEIARLFSEQQQLESKLASLRQRAFEDDSAALEISEVEETLATVAEQLVQRQREQARLHIKAPAGGVVLPMPARPAENRPGQLRRWSGTPLDSQNRDAFLYTGDAICRIGDPERLEAILVIDQRDVEYVRTGQAVELVLDPLPGHRVQTVLEHLSQLDLEAAPLGVSQKAGGDLVTTTDNSGRERPWSTSYQASAPVDDPEGRLLVGATGKARILTGRQTLAQRAWRFFCQTFSFDV